MQNESFGSSKFPFSSLPQLSSYLEITPQELRWICGNIDNNYKTRNIKKKSGKLREIASPNKKLRLIQKKLLLVLRELPFPPYIHTGAKARSIKSAAEPHYRAPLLVKIDVRDFYPSIRFTRVLSLFEKTFGLTSEISWHLAKLMTFKEAVPQGAITSPTLAALIIYKNGQGLAVELQNLSLKFNGNFSIYGDDANLSAPIGAKDHLLKSAKKVIEHNGFTWHPDPEKTNQRLPGQTKTTPGVDVTHGPDVPINKRLEYKRTLKKFETKGNLTSAEIKSFKGKIAYMSYLNPGAGKHYRKRLKKLQS